ncbi:argininosuccinate lyase [Candidatus Woesearchaeota archaeon]|nr:argininosuccinate lyase [Candidatus Woesearchaeota archaeon]
MTKLWHKGTDSDKAAEKFTVGNDSHLDKKLLKYDAIASTAHAEMLAKIGVLGSDELSKIKSALKEAIADAEKGTFEIRQSDEDCHTALENYLVKKAGEAGKKIHTARSRNDQVAAALRLYMLDRLAETAAEAKKLQNEINAAAKKNEHVPLPGYTHMQKAMPSSVKMWCAAFAAALEDDLKLMAAVKGILDQNPLGSGAGYGLPINADRELTAKLLGFSKVQETAYVQNSRGKFELLALQSLQQLMLDINKLATDLMLFSTSEFGFASLPQGFLTGSSIMPQKNNYDVLELARGKYGVICGCVAAVTAITANLPSGYNRDFQLTKEPLMKGIETTIETAGVMALVMKNLEFNEKKCREAMTQELYATQKAYELVKKGRPFREAYKAVAKDINNPTTASGGV